MLLKLYVLILIHINARIIPIEDVNGSNTHENSIGNWSRVLNNRGFSEDNTLVVYST